MLDRAIKKQPDLQVEIIVQAGEHRSCTAENGRISDFQTSKGLGIGVRVLRDGRVGFASCNNHEEFFEKTVENAVSASRIGELVPGFPEKVSEYPDPSGCFDRRVLEFTDLELIRHVEEMLETLISCKVRPTYAGMSVGSAFQEIANTNGILVSEKDTEASAGSYVSIGTSIGWWSKAARALSGIDVTSIAERTARMALESNDAEKIVSGKMPVILKPHCLSGEDGGGLLENTFVPSINGDRVVRGNSRFSPESIGKTVVSKSLDIIDDGTIDGGLGSGRSDGEGVPTGKTIICSGGILNSFLHDHASAFKMGLEKSTGNGFRSYSSMPHPSPSNLTFSSRTAIPEAELIEGITDGILVNWLSGTHTANDYSGDFSVEAKNAFIIRNGKIAEPVKAAMISGNVFEMLLNCQLASDNSIQSGSIKTPGMLATLSVVG